MAWQMASKSRGSKLAHGQDAPTLAVSQVRAWKSTPKARALDTHSANVASLLSTVPLWINQRLAVPTAGSLPLPRAMQRISGMHVGDWLAADTLRAATHHLDMIGYWLKFSTVRPPGWHLVLWIGSLGSRVWPAIQTNKDCLSGGAIQRRDCGGRTRCVKEVVPGFSNLSV
jgi:hypothetical protein